MNHDISRILRDWPYSGSEVTVRKVEGLDGQPKIQMRLDLGILQMELAGRPDGNRPHGFESLLEYQRHRLERHTLRAEAGLPNDDFQSDGDGTAGEFALDEEACSEMRSEAMQYYYRYLSLFHLGDYEAVLRDTQRNMEAFDFVRDHAGDPSDRFALEQFRPYVLMMHTRARACIHLEERQFDVALGIIDEGIEQIEEYLHDNGRDDLVESCRELQFLEEWRDRVSSNRPISLEEKLRQELRMAVETENYERAAELRDQLNAIVF
jgi:tetratricopeptide (TPR) repeat protein